MDPKSDVGILHKDANLKSLKKDEAAGISPDDKSGIFRCCCCGEALRLKSSAKFNRTLSMNAPNSSPRAPMFGGRNEDGGNMDLGHIRYSELKLTSDTKSEVLEDEDALINVENHSCGTPSLESKNMFEICVERSQ